MSRTIKVALIQQANNADIKDNMKRLRDSISRAAARGAQLVVLQELHNGLYFCQIENPDFF
ncbi:MAG TPA: nitrilase-related carbon-nitrogen hydrolase, partial [Spirochaetota bacterium]|nr:nitrilase-related carbon-nitrogen hydrolase [Spirochaetota bacterium]